MSLTEIQAALEKAPLEENLILLAWLRSRLGEKLDHRREQLSRCHAEIDRGEKSSLAELKALNRSLDAQNS